MYAKLVTAHVPVGARVIAISDIHGSCDLFRALLEKIGYSESDILVLVGDLCNKGNQNRETLEFVMTLALRENCYVLRGNGDRLQDWMTPTQRAFLENLPHILETEDYVFVHAALSDAPLDRQDAYTCVKLYNFIEKAGCFDKWIVTGHWPVVNYCHRIPSQNPFFDRRKKIVGIDGGCTVRWDGQLNALLMQDGQFGFAYVDDYTRYTAPHAQAAAGGNVHVTFDDRFVELLSSDGELRTIRHKKTGSILTVPDWVRYRDEEGALCAGTGATDYCLPVSEGEVLALIRRTGNRLFLKRNGVCGWYLE